MAYETILYEVQDGVGLVTINRPKVLNALSLQVLNEVADVVDAITESATVRVLIITGAGEKAFVAGADISEFPKMNPLQARAFAEKGQELFF
ncbi:MAG TPA: hypothetical protein DCE18_12955, partial [Syntrophobacteraceae bacterium]|nr:hypothetical protein [Syntrophobacteraceae bacterium]